MKEMLIDGAVRSVLTQLEEEGPSYALDLVNRSKGMLTRPGIFPLLSRMGDAGLVESSRGSPSERYIFTITERGSQRLHQSDPVAEAAVQQ